MSDLFIIDHCLPIWFLYLLIIPSEMDDDEFNDF